MGGRCFQNVDIALLAGLLLTRCCTVLAILDRKENLQAVTVLPSDDSHPLATPTAGDSQDAHIEEEPRRNYRVEDFFWSGSGDGSGDGRPDATWATTTIFMTTTVLTTIYQTPVFPSVEVGPSCSPSDCLLISPTPTIKEVEPTSSVAPSWPDLPDQHYWLVTIIQANNTALELSPAVFEQRLARIYTTAFHRQQEKHLGLEEHNSKTLKRERRETVSVKVHKVSAGGAGSALELIYTVRVAGKAVEAAVAAQDMQLVADNEVTAQLGFPVLTKAEPFLKPVVPADSSQRDVWLVVGASVSTILLILLLLFLLFFNYAKKSRSSDRSVMVHKETTSSGKDNMGFQQGSPMASESPRRRVVEKVEDDGGSVNSSDGEEGNAIDSHEVPRAMPRQKPSSPNSYLSMPSIKAFPSGAPIPGPLESVLEPDNPPLSRHSSASQDPGVVGPLVWDLHCHRLNKKENEDIAEAEPSVGRMRRRFHELLDDAFSLFGSRSGTPEEEAGSPAHNVYGRAKSAVIMPVGRSVSEKKRRPKTSDGRPSTAGLVTTPRGAWGTTPSTTPPVPRVPPRPLSAGPFHKPNLEPAWILTDSMLKPTDPAVPLIEAIKKELDKYPSNLPGAYRM